MQDLVFIPLEKFNQLDFNYGEAIHKSILFYEAQRSGVLSSF